METTSYGSPNRTRPSTPTYGANIISGMSVRIPDVSLQLQHAARIRNV